MNRRRTPRSPSWTLVSPSAARATMAVAHGARNVREVARACGWASTNTAHVALRRARDYGLVDWRDHHANTLHPTFGIVVGWGPRHV